MWSARRREGFRLVRIAEVQRLRLSGPVPLGTVAAPLPQQSRDGERVDSASLLTNQAPPGAGEWPTGWRDPRSWAQPRSPAAPLIPSSPPVTNPPMTDDRASARVRAPAMAVASPPLADCVTSSYSAATRLPHPVSWRRATVPLCPLAGRHDAPPSSSPAVVVLPEAEGPSTRAGEEQPQQLAEHWQSSASAPPLLSAAHPPQHRTGLTTHPPLLLPPPSSLLPSPSPHPTTFLPSSHPLHPLHPPLCPVLPPSGPRPPPPLLSPPVPPPPSADFDDGAPLSLGVQPPAVAAATGAAVHCQPPVCGVRDGVSVPAVHVLHLL